MDTIQNQTRQAGCPWKTGNRRKSTVRDLFKLNPALLFSLVLQAETGIPSLLEDKRFLFGPIAPLLNRKTEFSNPVVFGDTGECWERSQIPLSIRPLNKQGLDRADILLSDKEGYLKAAFFGASEGLVFVEMLENKLLLSGKDIPLLCAVYACFEDKRGGNDIFKIQHYRDNILQVEMIKPEAGLTRETLAIFFDFMNEIMQYRAFPIGKEHPYGVTIFEGKIPTPMIAEGTTWEIRVFTQLIDGKIFQNHCTRLAASDFYLDLVVPQSLQKALSMVRRPDRVRVANSLFGVSEAYRELFPNIQECEVAILVDDFIESAGKYAKKIGTIIGRELNRLKEEFLPGFPYEDVSMTSYVVDFMGRITPEGLAPEPVDINVVDPCTWFLRGVDPKQHDALLKRAAQITWQTYIHPTLGRVAKNLVARYVSAAE